MAGTSRIVKRAWPLYTIHDNSSLGILRAAYENTNDFITDLERIRAGMAEFIGSSAVTPSEIADGNEEDFEITVTSAALGDFVTGVSYSVDLVDCYLTADVTVANTVTCVMANNTGGALTPAAGTLRVRVSSATQIDAAADLIASTFVTPELGD